MGIGDRLALALKEAPPGAITKILEAGITQEQIDRDLRCRNGISEANIRKYGETLGIRLPHEFLKFGYLERPDGSFYYV